MSADYIKMTIDSLGKDIASLIRVGVVPIAAKKNKVFPEDSVFHINIINGVELKFYEKTQCLESVTVTVEKERLGA